jgi:hypothetical protein
MEKVYLEIFEKEFFGFFRWQVDQLLKDTDTVLERSGFDDKGSCSSGCKSKRGLQRLIFSRNCLAKSILLDFIVLVLVKVSLSLGIYLS